MVIIIKKTIIALVFSCFIMFDPVEVSGMSTCPALVWSDEFDGDALDVTNNWSHQEGDGCNIGLCGWGNNELQQYQAASTTVSNGLLTITADRQDLGGNVRYTSSRINSKGKKSFQYGLIEARIKIPASQGLWPAFWMLGDNIDTVAWPACGELDIMENIGREPKTVHGTMHFGPLWPNNQYSGQAFSLPGEERFDDDFHLFSMEKFQDHIRMLVDGVAYFTRKPEDIAPEAWPFNGPFHILLNVAIGGLWPGNPDHTTVFPSKMEVDYVRVYDNVFGNLEGPMLVSQKESGVVYTVVDGLLSYDYAWSVPEGVMITSGQGTSSITVSFGPQVGYLGSIAVVMTSSDECGSTADRSYKIPVSVHAKEFSFVSMDGNDIDEASVLSSSGTFETGITNPISSEPLNGSPKAFRYQRNGSEQYDSLILSTDAIADPNVYATGGTGYFKMDVYTTAPAGTTVMLQLENSARNGLDYPAGRHSRYEATLEGGSGWQRLDFQYVNFPDRSETIVDRIVLLFAPNTYTSDVYYLDNLDSYSSKEGAGTISPAPTRTPSPTLSPSPSSSPSISQIPTAEASGQPSSSPSAPVPTAVPIPPSLGLPIATNGGNGEYDQGALVFATGIWYAKPNPIPAPHISPLVVEYQRGGNHQYDVIFYSTDIISDPSEYTTGNRYFSMDVYAPTVPAGTNILVQLENSARIEIGYPIGRHSRYQAFLDGDANNGWQRLNFMFVDRPDFSEAFVDRIVVLFAPGEATSNTYYYDNFISFSSGATQSPAPSASPSAFPTNLASSTPSIASSNSPSMTPSPSSPEAGSSDFALVSGGDYTNDKGSLIYATGVWKFMVNPIPNDPTNSSPSVIEYKRSATDFYDVIFYSTDSIPNPNDYSSGYKYFTMDIHVPGNLPAGTPVLLQLENSATNIHGYPNGRHSRYRAFLDGSSVNSWQKLRFKFVDQPDPAETVADRVILLFGPATFTRDVYYYDNLESHTA